jgi:hypothetical protein
MKEEKSEMPDVSKISQTIRLSVKITNKSYNIHAFNLKR